MDFIFGTLGQASYLKISSTYIRFLLCLVVFPDSPCNRLKYNKGRRTLA